MSEPNIVVVDYHKGNLSSVVRGLTRAGAHAFASDDPDVIARADGIVLPGVGSFTTRSRTWPNVARTAP